MKMRAGAVAILIALAIGASYPTLRAQARQPETSADTRSVWDGVYSEEQAQRGEPLYLANCASCHGDTLKGSGETPPLSGGPFMANWNGLTLGDLFERIRTTMPQDKPGRLSRQYKADILAYVLKFNKFPTGKSELEHQTEFLREIRFEATKPDGK
jgi:mono/diheme cytochrome c family protein